MTAGPALVILDRDGVINIDSADYIRSPEQWRPLPGSLEAIAQLHDAGTKVVVATNQSGIGRGFFDEAMLSRIHSVMRAAVEAAGGRIDRIYHCPHTPWDGCNCRKPRPGMLEQAFSDYGVSPDAVPFIGDHLSDVDAAIAAGAIPVLVGDAETQFVDPKVNRFPDLAAAVDSLLSSRVDPQC